MQFRIEQQFQLALTTVEDALLDPAFIAETGSLPGLGRAELLSIDDLPPDFEYPKEFIRVVELGLTNLEPWWIVQGQLLRDRFQGIQKRHPDRKLVLFAVRQDNDDVACWDLDQGNVVVVHDFSSPGFERRAEFPGFSEWLRQAVEELIAFQRF